MSLPIGTKVRLASGGPEMLIVDIFTNGFHVVCAWDDGKQEMIFPTVCLDIIRGFHIVDWKLKED